MDFDAEKVLPDEHGQTEGRGNRAARGADDHQRGDHTSRQQQHDHENQRER